ncbi:MAG: tetratricopeptide repeat protein [Burkholderiales bacterium]|nr:tetratricopeptide repeat protein [Burkholderiales bacterium]
MAKRARALAAKKEYGKAIEMHTRALALAKTQHGPRHEYVAYILDDLATWHYHQQRFDDAIRFSKQAVEVITEARGPESVELASLLNNQGSMYSGNGQLQEAAALYEKSHAIFLKALGPNHERTAHLARNIGIANVELSRFDVAEKYFFAAVEANRAAHGENNPGTAQAYIDLAGAKLRQERPGEARKLVENARRITANQNPVNAADLAAADVKLAQIDIYESQLAAAKARLDQALVRLAGSPDPLARASVLYNLGWIHILRRQAVEAERMYKEALPLYRNAVGQNHPAVGRILHSLAIVYQDLGQFDEAERYYQQAMAIFAASFGEIDASVAATRLEYSSLLTERNRAADAIHQARSALSIYDRLPGKWDLKRGYAFAVLGYAQHKAGDLAAAAKTTTRAIELITQVRGDQSSDLPPGLTDLGRIYRAQGRLQDAEHALKKAILIREKDAAVTPAGLAESLSELANVRAAQGNAIEALAISRRTVEITGGRLDVAQQSLSAGALGEQRQARGLFEQFLEIGSTRLMAGGDALLKEMFEVAQFPHLTGTSSAVSRMAARFSASKSELAQLVRERQDAVERWRALDRSLVEGLTQTQGRAPGTGKEQETRRELAELTQRIEKLDERLRNEFPRYAELTNPRPVSATSAQLLLQADEALLLQVTSDKATYLFLAKANGLRFARTELTSRQLQQAVDSIRKGLDIQNISRLSELPPFDTAAAHLLYQRLIQPFKQELKEVKHIVAVLDRAMQNLPLSLLLATPVDAAPKRLSDFSRLDFLGRHFAFSVEPSVSAFSVLRSATASSRAAQPFIGFGDPVLEGSGTAISSRGALVDQLVTEINPATLRAALLPLPETRDELKAVAKSLAANDSDLYFGSRASEKVVKETDLSKYRIVAFATHGLLAGEFRGLVEPALVLTPPEKTTSTDDGLLMASEIASLVMDADWVLLSACNTAAPSDRAGAEGLSGLAKAFFYAGSRALLVSHWWVASDTTALLTTGAIHALAENPEIGRAEALRRAMLPLMDGKIEPRFAHPVFWAPFTNVGEGGRVR